MDIVMARKLDDPFGGLAFQNLHLGRQAGFSQAESQVVHVGFRLGLPDLPIQWVNGAAPALLVGDIHDMQELDLGLEGSGYGYGVGQDALGQRRSIYGKKDPVEHIPS
jgi:hypothetical protein